MKYPLRSKVIIHGRGAGGITERDIERRAHELASINGRPPRAVTARDFLEARRELAGEDLPPTIADDAEGRGALSRDPSEPPSEFGHKVPDLEGIDEQQAAESLAEEGVEEAQHEQMLAARRQARRQDQGE